MQLVANLVMLIGLAVRGLEKYVYWCRRTAQAAAQAGSPRGVLGAKVLHMDEVLFLYHHDEQVLETARYPVLRFFDHGCYAGWQHFMVVVQCSILRS